MHDASRFSLDVPDHYEEAQASSTVFHYLKPVSWSLNTAAACVACAAHHVHTHGVCGSSFNDGDAFDVAAS